MWAGEQERKNIMMYRSGVLPHWPITLMFKNNQQSEVLADYGYQLIGAPLLNSTLFPEFRRRMCQIDAEASILRAVN